MAHKSKSLKIRANVLLSVMQGHELTSEIAENCGVCTSSIQFHLNYLVDIGCVIKEILLPKQSTKMRKQAVYTFVDDRENLIENHACLPSRPKAIVDTDFLKRMMGYTDIKPAEGRVITEKDIQKCMWQQGVTVWNPSNKKSDKVWVAGSTLSDAI